MRDNFLDDNDDDLGCHSNFGESTGFGDYIEDLGGSGAQIRDFEEIITIGPDGVESELHGFEEKHSPMMNIWVEEILDTIGPDQGEGAGPFEVCADFELQDYIMFRTCSFEESWNYEKKEFELKQGSLIRWNLNPVDAINYAREIYRVNELRFHYERAYVGKRLADLNTEDLKSKAILRRKKKSANSGMALRFRSWMKLHFRTDPEDLVPFHFEYEPVIEDLMTVNDSERTVHEQYDEAFLREQEEWDAAEARFCECFKEDEGGRLEKDICPEEMKYRSRLKEQREERAKSILSWIERNSTQSVSEAFRKGGPFQTKLRNSRTVCLHPNPNKNLPPRKDWGRRFRTPAELYLTKEQAIRCVAAAERKLQDTK